MNKILILNTIMSFIILLIALTFKKTKVYVMHKFIISLLLPIAGPIYVILTLMFQYKNYNGENIEEYEKYIREKLDISHVKEVNKEKEINIVPLEEALILNPDYKKREIVIDMLKKENIIKYINSLKKALEDSDTETSHYAASAILEIKGEFNKKLRGFKESYIIGNRKEEFLKEYVQCVYSYLNSGFLDNKNYLRYLKIFNGILEDLLKVNPYVEEEYYVYKIDTEIELQNYPDAKLYCKVFSEVYENNEKTFLAFMKLFYETRDKGNFYTMLQALKSCPVKLSNDALEIVRFWSEGDEDE